MARFFTHWITTALALGVTAWIVPGVHVSSLLVLLIAAIVLGLINAVIRPLLVILTLPVTVLTLGLFYLVVNGVSFALAAALVPGFSVSSLLAAVVAALVMSLVSWFVGSFADDRA